MPLIGYWVMITYVLSLTAVLFGISHYYLRIFKSGLRFLNSILIGVPLFLVYSLIAVLLSDIDFQGTRVYSHYTHGYAYHLLEEGGKVFIAHLALFVLISNPIYLLFKRLFRAKSQNIQAS